MDGASWWLLLDCDGLLMTTKLALLTSQIPGEDPLGETLGLSTLQNPSVSVVRILEQCQRLTGTATTKDLMFILTVRPFIFIFLSVCRLGFLHGTIQVQPSVP